MDWFERLTGFREGGYEETRARLAVVDGRLRGPGPGPGPGHGVGTLTLPSLAELREAVRGAPASGRPVLRIVEGDVRALHAEAVNRGALFQVASQFNMLEMVGPDVSPEDGVTRYRYDRTQGPACAMAAGAATIYRNYLVPLPGGTGQTTGRQIDGLADLGLELARRLKVPVESLWTMRNGYALPSAAGLAAIDGHLAASGEGERDDLRARLRLGLHADVEVTDGPAPGASAGRTVSQIFCSALPVAYSALPAARWAAFARLVLEAAYEGTLLAGVANARRGASDRVLLTRLGGGAFGNDDEWIDDAILRALRLVEDAALDVAIVSFGPPSRRLSDFVARSGFAPGRGGGARQSAPSASASRKASP